jgi:hypothetical protein
LGYRTLVGKRENYFIHDGYAVRLDNEDFDDTGFKDEFQLQVYQWARQLVDRLNFQRVIDLGCGSGYKLMTNFFDKQTLGIDLQACHRFLQSTKWKGRDWQVFDPSWGLTRYLTWLSAPTSLSTYQTLTSFMHYIAEVLQPKVLVISTPERDQLCLGTHNGPPKNIHHVREWNFAQFNAYVQPVVPRSRPLRHARDSNCNCCYTGEKMTHPFNTLFVWLFFLLGVAVHTYWQANKSAQSKFTPWQSITQYLTRYSGIIVVRVVVGIGIYGIWFTNPNALLNLSTAMAAKAQGAGWEKASIVLGAIHIDPLNIFRGTHLRRVP